MKKQSKPTDKNGKPLKVGDKVRFLDGSDVDHYQTGAIEEIEKIIEGEENEFITFGTGSYYISGLEVEKVEDKNYNALYDFVDQQMIEGDEVAKKMIEEKGYSLTYDELHNFVDEKMIEGDEEAEKILAKVNQQTLTNKTRERTIKTKQLTAERLLKFLVELRKNGHDLSKIKVNHRADRDADVEVVDDVEEDLFDSETNSVLESIVIINDAREI